MSATGNAQRNDQSERQEDAAGIVVSGGELRHIVMGHQHIESQTVLHQTYNPVGGVGTPVHPGTFGIYSHILVHEFNPISASSRVFNADLRSGVTGNKAIVVKLTPHGPKFLREAKIHFSVPHHKNIVERIATDVFNFRGVPTIFIAMERCDCNLHGHIKSEVRDEKSFNPEKYTWINYQILVALDFLHSQNVFHGDLKPSNVLLILNGNIVKLSDFGLSRAISEGHDSTQITSPQGGSSGWLAPEILEGTTQVSKFSDIFPCGLVLHFTWSHGKHAFGDNPVSRNHFIMVGENRDLSRMLIDFMDEATTLLERMFQRNPADRPTTQEILQSPIFERFGPHTSQIPPREVIKSVPQPTPRRRQHTLSQQQPPPRQSPSSAQHSSTTPAQSQIEAASGTSQRGALKGSQIPPWITGPSLRTEHKSPSDPSPSQRKPQHHSPIPAQASSKASQRASTSSNTSASPRNPSDFLLARSDCDLILISPHRKDEQYLRKLTAKIFGTASCNFKFIKCGINSDTKVIQDRLSNMTFGVEGIAMVIVAWEEATAPLAEALEENNLRSFLQNKSKLRQQNVLEERIQNIRQNLAVFTFAPLRYISQDLSKIAVNIGLTEEKNDKTGKLQEEYETKSITFQAKSAQRFVKDFIKNSEVMEFIRRKLT